MQNTFTDVILQLLLFLHKNLITDHWPLCSHSKVPPEERGPLVQTAKLQQQPCGDEIQVVNPSVMPVDSISNYTM